MSPERNRADADFLRKALRLAPDNRVLDIPCGQGRHSIELAREGFHVTGIDLSEESIAEAKTNAASLPADFRVGDMRDLASIPDLQGTFDGAFCFGNSFAYLNFSQAAAFFAGVSAALRPGGRFALETGMAAESILPGLQKSRWFEFGGIYMLSQNEYDPREGCLDIEYTFIRNGQIDKRPTTSYLFTANEICRMHEAAGLRILDLFGSVAGEPYRLGSPALIAVSEKR